MYTEIPSSRREEIAARLAQGQPVEAFSLANEFRISEDAIRRDLRALAAEGRCRRVYGGALPPLKSERPISPKIVHALTEVRDVAASAAQTVLPGEFVFLTSGNSNLAIVEFLPKNSSLTIATNSIDIASLVLNRGNIPLIFVGGAVTPVAGACFDATSIEVVEEMNIDRCFIEADAVSAHDDISGFEHADVAFKRAVLRRSRIRIGIAPLKAFSHRAPYRIAKGDEIDSLVIPNNVPVVVVNALTAAGFMTQKALLER